MTTPEKPLQKIHSEQYNNQALFTLRIARLYELEYAEEYHYNPEIFQQFPDHQNKLQEGENHAISSLLIAGKQVAIIRSKNCVSIMARHPNTNLPTAEEDFDSPAGENTVTDFVINQIRQSIPDDPTITYVKNLIGKNQ